MAAAMVLLIAGCNTPETPLERLDLAVPDGWTARASTRPLPDYNWVATFNDSRLDALVAEAIQSNRDLRATAARIKSAEANAKIAGADIFPSISGDLDGVRSQRNFIGFPFGGGGPGVVSSSRSNSFGLALNISWELDIWGRVRAGKKAALSELQASEADFSAAQLSLAGQTCKVWFGMVAAQEQLELARSALQIFTQTEEIIRGQFEEGIGENTAAQLQLSLADIENAKASVQLRERQLLQVRRQLEVILGQYPDGDLAGRSVLPVLPGPPPAGIPAELLDRRPDLLASERRLASGDNRVLQARRSLLPAITLTGSYGTSTPDLEEILNSDFNDWSFAGGVTQPILQGGRLRQTVKLREAEQDELLAQFQQTALQAFSEVEIALGSEKLLAEREFALRRAVGHNRSALERARDDYAGGVGDVLTLLQAQQQLIQAETSLIDARRERLENRVDLHVALGGGFSAPQPAPAPNPVTKPEPDS